MNDWTIVATTLGASGITGLVAFASARLQSKTVIEQVRAENERLKLQHREDHLRNRQSTYHEFLDETSTFERMRLGVYAIFDAQSLSEEDEAARLESVRRFRHLLNGVRLFATREANAAAERLQRLHDEIEKEWFTRAAAAREMGSTQPPGFAFPQHRIDEWDQVLEAVIDAMRADVAPA